MEVMLNCLFCSSMKPKHDCTCTDVHLSIIENLANIFIIYIYFTISFSHTEFIDVGKPARALDTLQEVFRNKKWTYTWSESVIEPIMFKYLDLCVELKKSHIAKEGLFQYRNMFQLVIFR